MCKETVQDRRGIRRNSLHLAGKPYKLYLCSALGKLGRSKGCRNWIRASFPMTPFLLISWLLTELDKPLCTHRSVFFIEFEFLQMPQIQLWISKHLKAS